MSEPSPRLPLGPALEWDDKELDRLAEITPADIDAAQGWVEQNASKQARRLWDAKSEEAE